MANITVLTGDLRCLNVYLHVQICSWHCMTLSWLWFIHPPTFFWRTLTFLSLTSNISFMSLISPVRVLFSSVRSWSCLFFYIYFRVVRSLCQSASITPVRLLLKQMQSKCHFRNEKKLFKNASTIRHRGFINSTQAVLSSRAESTTLKRENILRHSPYLYGVISHLVS